MPARGLRTGTIGALAGMQLTGEDMGPLEIEAADLANATITYTKLVSGAQTGYLTRKYIQKDAVTCSQIADNAVIATAISAGTITNAKLVGAIAHTKLLSGAATGYLTTKYVQKDAITSSGLADNAVIAAAISAGTITNAKLAGAIAHTKLLSGAATGYLTTKYVQKDAITSSGLADNAVIAAAISAGTITNAKLAGAIAHTKMLSGAATGYLTAKYIQAGTVQNANLSSPDGYFSLRTRIAKRAANQAAGSVAFLGRLPVAASLVHCYAAASVINNVALTSPPLCVWLTNGTNRLLSGSGIVVPSTAFRPASGAVQSAAQAAGVNIFVSAKTSTTTSGLGVDVVSVWKAPHTT